MRKILAIVLAIAMLLSLCAGCNNSRIVYDDDLDDEPISIAIGGVPDDDVEDEVEDVPEDDDAEDETDEDSNVDDDQPDDGPAVEWPSVLPPFDGNGEIDSIELREDGTYIITIIGTTRNEAQTYARGSRDYGWERINFRYLDPDTMRIRKGAYLASVTVLGMGTYSNKTAVITLQTWHEEEELPSDWPADRLPEGFPVYTSGKINYVRAYTIDFQTETDLSINFDGSSKGAVEKYATVLKDAGWKVEHIGNERFLSYSEDQQNGDSWTFEKDGVYGVVEFHKLFGGAYIQIIDKKFID